MRLLYLSADPGIPVFGGKGASIHLQALVEALDGLGHDLLVASPRLEAGPNSLPEGVRSVQIPAVRPRECATEADLVKQAVLQTQALASLARAEAPEAIYERYSLASFAGARVGKALDIPLVVEVNAPLREEEERFRKLAHAAVALRAERETFAAARRIFTVSAPLGHWLSSNGVDVARVEVLGNAPPTRIFAPKAAIAENSEVVVGFAGGLKPWHGIETLARGLALALESGARMRLEILGTGPAEDVIDRVGLPESRTRRLGTLPHEKALDVLEGWDVGVAPFSAFKGFYFSPLKLFEYMAAGLCPVVSDIGELVEIVEHGSAGMVVPPDDAGALAGALLELDRDRVRLRDLGAKAQSAVRRRPSWEDNARRVVAAIENVAGVASAGTSPTPPMPRAGANVLGSSTARISRTKGD